MSLPQIRASKEIMDIIKFIKAKHMLEGRDPPPIHKILTRIANKINKEDLWRNEFAKI